MNLTQIAVNGAAKLLLDHQLWADVKMFVADVSGETHLTNGEKQAKVKADLVMIFGEVESFILNLAIELAVTFLSAAAATK